MADDKLTINITEVKQKLLERAKQTNMLQLSIVDFSISIYK